MRRRDVIAALPAVLAGCPSLRPDGGDTATDRARNSDDAGTETTMDQPTPESPQVEWAFVQDSPTVPVTVRHESGDSLTTENTARLELVVTTWPDHPIPTDATLTPTRTPTTHRRTWRELATGDPYPIEAGDSVTLEAVTPGDDVEVRWYRSDDHDGEVLGSTTLPKES